MSEKRQPRSPELRTHYLFAALNEAQWSQIRPHTRLRDLAAGQHLFSRGDVAREFFVLLEGMVKLYRASPEGHEKIMRLVRTHMSFAESVMFMAEPRYPVNAQAVEASRLVSIESVAYLDILRDSFEATRAVMARMTERIHARWDDIEALALQDTRYRVISYLLSLVPADARSEARFTLPSRKTLIASQLSVTPETLSRVLHALRDEHLIDIREYDVHVPDVAALRRSLS